MHDVSLRRPIPAGTRIRGLIDSARLSTRVWFDTIAPLAMLCVVSEGAPPLWPAVAVVAIMVLMHAAANYFNDLNDTQVDRSSVEETRNQRALLTDRVSRRDLTVVGWTMIAASMAIAIALPWPSAAFLGALLVLAHVYNFPPIRLSARPVVLQVFWPVVWALLYGLCAAAVGSDDWVAGLPFLAFVALFMGIGEGITQDIRDVDNDAAGGRRTTPVVFGVAASATVAWAVQALSLGAWTWFAIEWSLPVAAAVAGGAAIVAWLAYFARLADALRRSFDKAAARMTHVGPIYAFTAVNLCTIVGVVAA